MDLSAQLFVKHDVSRLCNRCHFRLIISFVWVVSVFLFTQDQQSIIHKCIRNTEEKKIQRYSMRHFFCVVHPILCKFYGLLLNFLLQFCILQVKNERITINNRIWTASATYREKQHLEFVFNRISNIKLLSWELKRHNKWVVSFFFLLLRFCFWKK